MTSNEKALKSGVWYTISSFLLRGMSFLTTPLFTRLLSQEEYGQFNNYISWQGILLIITTFNVKASLISARYDYERLFDQYIYSVQMLSTASVLVWMGMLNLFSKWAESFFGIGRFWLNLMLVYLIFETSLELFQDQQRFLYKYKLQVCFSLLTALLSVGLSLFLVVTMDNKLYGRIWGNVLPTIAIGLGLYIYFAYKGKRVDFGCWKYAIKICLPYIPHLLSLNILSSMDRIMITKYCGSVDTALYSLAYNCGFIASILATSMNTAYGPWLAEQLYDGDTDNVRRFSRPYIGAFCCCMIGFMAIAPEVLLVLGGKKYLSAMYVMPPVAMGCASQFLYTMFVNVEQIRKKTVGMAFASASAAVLNYVLNMIFIPRYGYVAAAYTTLAGYVWLLLVHMFLVHRINMSAVYSYRFIYFVVLAVGVITAGINFLYSHSIARYIFLAVYIIGICGVIYFNSNRIIPAVKLVLQYKKNMKGKSELRNEKRASI